MISRLFALALGALPLLAMAEEPIPIEQEPRHRLRFENEFVRYFDVELEPGYLTRFHWHRNDGVFVNIASSPTIAEDLGKDPVARAERAIGETYFIDYGARPKAHRITNAGQSPYHVVDAEIVKSCGSGTAGEGPNQTLLIDNARAFVTRIVLHPGESTELYAPCGVLVSVSGGSVTTESAGIAQQIGLSPAGYIWRRQAGTMKLTNSGPYVFHGVDIRLK
ncbi:MAG TPA: hypothetical protein VHB46_09775 [Burkholderiales bacterium]|nr:hypothetical protein [Burkholderiales bacterium]